jgi:hypothetical protein
LVALPLFFCALDAWLSIIAADGLASRTAASRRCVDATNVLAIECSRLHYPNDLVDAEWATSRRLGYRWSVAVDFAPEPDPKSPWSALSVGASRRDLVF